eukprot:6669865-Lingulodinium_polyedra.AAC.1
MSSEPWTRPASQAAPASSARGTDWWSPSRGPQAWPRMRHEARWSTAAPQPQRRKRWSLA